MILLTEAASQSEALRAWSVSDKIALAAFVISIVSAIVSVWSIFFQKRLNTVNLQAIFFEEIFKDYFIKKIPNAVKQLSFDNNGKLKPSYREFNKTFMKMMEDCAYFSYAKKDFYKELTDKCQNLEDRLITVQNQGIVNVAQQNEFIHSIENDISDIVKCINDNYSNN